MFRKVDNYVVQVNLATMKLRDTLKEVEKAIDNQGDDLAQRAAELHKVTEERFPNVTHSQDRSHQGRKSLPIIVIDVLEGIPYRFSSMENETRRTGSLRLSKPTCKGFVK
jgi:hypothetical protein